MAMSVWFKLVTISVIFTVLSFSVIPCLLC